MAADIPTASALDTTVRIAAFCRDLHATVSADASAVWGKITRAATTLLPGVEHASITVLDDRPSVQSRAGTDRCAEAVDTAQSSYLEGPGIDAAREQRPQRVDDLRTDGRWSTFVANTGATPIRSIMSYPLFQHEHGCGALNLYAHTPMAFAGPAGQLAEVFCCGAAVVVEAAHRDRQLHHLLTNRDLVGQAKGVLMERFGIDSRAAFSMLAQLADRESQPVPAIARKLLRRPNVPVARRASS
ncbi:transcriptional regulator [Mycolicibacterium litorale]|uniref:Transcriptional regulator n=1 Tax=Mycolicibacterium litorale TaxID=758802 RepID=A0A6S6PII8_9MYCO|nr:GAF and ANTAR domain-containing protein [Mycolicibacterium litorale]BCI55778.1 transcriptional regulator [Mycolicibacterium litorale]